MPARQVLHMAGIDKDKAKTKHTTNQGRRTNGQKMLVKIISGTTRAMRVVIGMHHLFRNRIAK